MRRDGDRRSHAARRSAPAGADRGVAAAVRPQGAPRRCARGGRGDGDDRAEGSRLRRHRRRAGAERALRGCGRRDRLRAVLHVAPHLDRAELVAGRRRGRRRAVRGRRRRRGCRARRGDHAGDRRVLPPARRASARLDRAVPVPGSRHGLPGGSRGRRRHRRAAEADRDVDVRRHRVGRARVVDPVARGRELGDPARGRGGARGHPRSALPRPTRAGRARARRRRTARDMAVRPRRARCRARRPRAARPAGAGASGRRRLPAALPDDPRRRDRAAPDRLLADRRRRACVRRPAPLPHRHQPGVGRAGHGQHGVGSVPGDAGLDEPVCELAQRSRPARAPRLPRWPPAGS